MNISRVVLLSGSALAGLAYSVPSYAQATPGASAGEGEIIVTARKRDETLIAVPVVMTAVDGATLERRAIANLDGLTRLVPQLQLGSGGGTIQGGHIGIRGIAGSDSNPFADQAVSFNIDGVQVSRSNIRRMAEMDTAQIEVLKGPQALFFGKNSPGGIISIRSADPTPSFAAKMSVGYEFKAKEVRAEGFVSGPLTDTLGARLAAYGTRMSGWWNNDYPQGTIYSPSSDRLPKPREFAVRGTLKWEPNDRFNARLKATYNELKDRGILTSQENVFCPAGVSQLGNLADNCRPDGQGARANLGEYLGTIAPRFRDGVPYLKMKQALISFEMNYDITDALSLTSVTGYYYLNQEWADTFNLSGNAASQLPSGGFFGNKEFSQELRLSSDFDGPFNFLLGGFYQKAKAFVGAQTFAGVAQTPLGANPTQLNNYNLHQRGQAYSVFGQVILNPIEQIEITAGGRYSYEKKRLPLIESAPGVGPGPIDRVVIPENPAFPRRDSWDNFSPEITVSYRPTPDLNIFVSHKRGFLSGGFNSGATNFASDLRFDQQKIKGFEGGIKAALFDRKLRTNLSVYRYVVTGLQVTTSTTVEGQAPVQTVINAGKTTVKGVEFDFNYETPLDGLTLYGAVGYNDAKYDIFSVGCYVGQSQAEGCNFGALNPLTGRYALQDLAGHPLLRAPKWSGSVGAGYEANIGDTLKIGLNADMNFSSSYDTNVTATPAGIQKSYQLLDANIRVGTQDDRWELALIGRNLTNKFFVNRTVDVPLTGAGATTGSILGGLKADTQGAVNRGREIMLRVTFRYGN